jgi:hypothetical protein
MHTYITVACVHVLEEPLAELKDTYMACAATPGADGTNAAKEYNRRLRTAGRLLPFK